MKNNFKTIDKVIMYSFNYEHQFIENVWPNYLAKHLREKFSNFCHKYNNTQTGFMYLYTSLSQDNKEMLINHILKTY